MASVVHFCSSLSYSQVATYFADNAKLHRLRKAEVGLIIGIYSGFISLFSAIFGIYLKKIGTKFVLISGLIVAGTSSCLFGLLDSIVESGIYLICGVVLRAMEGIGCAGYLISGSCLLIETWSGSRLSMSLGIYEMSSALGFTFGPIIGALLYQVGGFSVPFFAVGAVLIIIAFVAFFIIENDSEREIISPYEIFLLF